jgi:dTDP-4-dehydrorhamnose reductase
MPRIALLGANGMFGKDAATVFERAGYEVAGADLPEVDIAFPSSLASFLDAHPASVVVNAAAYTNVDGAEDHRQEAFRINALGAEMVAEACRDRGLTLLHISTDYVFPGEKPEGYSPGDPPGPPINAYGASKLAGEEAIRSILPEDQVLLCRTQWLYGRHGKNFVDTIRSLAAHRSRIEVVDDQWGVPTHTAELARQMTELLSGGARGVAHAVGGGGPITWCAFAREIVALGHLPCEVVACTSEAFPRPARRPRHAWLRSESPGIARDWKDTLAHYLKN